MVFSKKFNKNTKNNIIRYILIYKLQKKTIISLIGDVFLRKKIQKNKQGGYSWFYKTKIPNLKNQYRLRFGIFLLRKSKEIYSLVSSSFLLAGCLSSLAAFLNSLSPLPNPFINSGIFLPPKSNKTIAKITRISVTPNLPMIKIIYCRSKFVIIRGAKVYRIP